MKPQPPSLPCHACTGRFAFLVEDERFVCRHTLPYCDAFNAIKNTLDALKFVRECELKNET